MSPSALTTRTRSLLLPSLVAAVAAAGCGKDVTGTGGADFPTIAAAVEQLYCIRANITPPTVQTGAVGVSDCDSGDGYFVSYRVRVTESGSHTFTTDATFDTVLVLYEIPDLGNYEESADLVARNDDYDDTLNSQFTTTLSPETEYLLVIVGYDASEVGTYELDIT